MERAIFCDIDGCLNDGKHTGFDLETLQEISEIIAELAARDIGFYLCTGRPQPYGEAIAQVLYAQTPFVCENGAMVFEPETDHATSLIDEADKASLKALRIVLEAEGFLFEPGNECSLSIASFIPEGDPADYFAARCAELAKQHARFGLNWTSSSTSVDITPSGISKKTGIMYLLDRLELSPDAAFAIGDGNNDLQMLGYVGHAMCPSNAGIAVKSVCDTVAGAATAKGTAELLKGVLAGL